MIVSNDQLRTSKKQKVSLVFTTLLFLITSSFFVTPVAADRLKSDSYVITFGNFNFTSGEKSSANYTVTDTVGQTADGPYGEYGNSSYFIGSGFQYIYQIGEFGFSISNTKIDFGELTLNQHQTASNQLTISHKGANGYTVFAYETHPLRHSNQSFDIPDTTCNSNNCDHITAGVWDSNQTPGFGFTMSGENIPSDFTDSTYFRQFANQETSEPMQAVMQGNNVGTYTATVTYKVGVDATYPAGNYQTSIVFVAVPEY